jgi:DNA-binding transcriptional LysR family regulator
MRLPSTKLEQWIVLQTVIEQGSYAQAAITLNRSQSSVSYALNVLQQRLGLPLLQIVGRKAELTEPGRVLLAQAQPLIMAFSQLEQRALALKSGVLTQLTLVVDSVFPKPILFRALRRFQQLSPDTQVHLTEILRSETPQHLNQRNADIYITTLPVGSVHSGQFLLEVDFVPVVKSDHPLLAQPVPLSVAELGHYPLITLADKQLQQEEKRRVAAQSNWTFTTIDAAIEAICHGVGYGWMPYMLIEQFIHSGQLAILPLTSQTHRKTPFYLWFATEQHAYDQTVNAFVDEVLSQMPLRQGAPSAQGFSARLA